VPTVHEPKLDYTDLKHRARVQWGRTRADIEHDIRNRQQVARRNEKEVLDGWE